MSSSPVSTPKATRLQPAAFILPSVIVSARLARMPLIMIHGTLFSFFCYQLVADFVQALGADVGAVVQQADFLRAQFFDQVPELRDHILRRARAPLDGHDRLRAEGAAIRATARGQHAERLRAVDGIGRGLQAAIAIHLEVAIGRERQRVQVHDRRAFRVAPDFAIARLVGDAEDRLQHVAVGLKQ